MINDLGWTLYHYKIEELIPPRRIFFIKNINNVELINAQNFSMWIIKRCADCLVSGVIIFEACYYFLFALYHHPRRKLSYVIKVGSYNFI